MSIASRVSSVSIHAYRLDEHTREHDDDKGSLYVILIHPPLAQVEMSVDRPVCRHPTVLGGPIARVLLRRCRRRRWMCVERRIEFLSVMQVVVCEYGLEVVDGGVGGRGDGHNDGGGGLVNDERRPTRT